MKKLPVIFLLAALAAAPVRSAPPSPESIDKLLTLTKAEQTGDKAMAQVERMVRSSVNQALQGQALSPADQKAVDELVAKAGAAFHAALDPAAIKAAYAAAYAKAYTQEEIDGLVAFYSGPAGQAFAAKQSQIEVEVAPRIQQAMMAAVRPLQAGLRDLVEGIQAAHASADAADAPAAPEKPLADAHAKADAPLHISHGQEIALKDYVATGKTTVFDFYSDYCPPCRALMPLMEKLHHARADLSVVKIDINRPGVKGIDWGSPVAKEFKLESIPHLKVYNPDGTLKAEGDEARALVEGWLESMDKS